MTTNPEPTPETDRIRRGYAGGWDAARMRDELMESLLKVEKRLAAANRRVAELEAALKACGIKTVTTIKVG